MMRRIQFRQISTGSVYKLVFAGSVVGSIPIFAILGVFGAFGYDTVSWNEQSVVGLKALVLSPLVGLFIAAVFAAVVGTFTALGLWIISKFAKLDLYCDVVPGFDASVADP